MCLFLITRLFALMADELAAESIHNLNKTRFYRIYTTVHEMLADRGYTPDTPFLSKKKWDSKYLGYLADLEDPDNEQGVFGVIDNMSLLFSKPGKKKLLVYFHPLDTKLNQNDMNYIHNFMKEKEAPNLIIVANNKATPKVSSVLGILGNRAQLFNEDELIFNVTKHQLVPKHILASEEEKDIILRKYTTMADGKTHKELIPAMLSNDAVAKYFNFKVDDLIRIERPRADGFYDLSYRIVTHPMTSKEMKTN